MASSPKSSFSAEQLLSILPPLSGVPRLWVAYSGGCDSHVLLHALCQLRETLPPIYAIHIDHGLHVDSSAWAAHCQVVCRELDVDCTVQRVDALPASGQSPEDAARHVRYQAFSHVVADGEWLCLAHHQDDQAETFLLQLLRGAGPKGLAAMALQSNRLGLPLCRPLLGFSREDLEAYATSHGLVWVDDPSNFETDYRRNFLRHDVVPAIKNHWPAVNKVIARSAAHCAEAAELLAELAAQDLAFIASQGGGCVSVERLQALSVARQKNALRYWILQRDLPVPSDVKLRHVLSDVVLARDDAQPCVHWRGGEVRRYRGDLYAQSPTTPKCYKLVCTACEYEKMVNLPDGTKLLWQDRLTNNIGIDGNKMANKKLFVRYRQGHEACRPAGQRHQRSLKNLFQEAGVPPWLRDCYPLLYAEDELIAVIGLCVTDGWQSDAGVGWVWVR